MVDLTKEIVECAREILELESKEDLGLYSSITHAVEVCMSSDLSKKRQISRVYKINPNFIIDTAYKFNKLYDKLTNLYSKNPKKFHLFLIQEEIFNLFFNYRIYRPGDSLKEMLLDIFEIERENERCEQIFLLRSALHLGVSD